MSNFISDISISAIKSHLIKSNVFNGVDLLFYESVLNEFKSDKLTYKSNMDLAKKNRVFSILIDIKNKRNSVFSPLTFKTHCCSVDVEFFNDDRGFYFCPICGSKVTAHGDFMPMGILAHKRIRKLRVQLHRSLDSFIKEEKITRYKAYELLAKKLKKNVVDVHIGNVTSLSHVVDYYHSIQLLKSEFSNSH